VFQQKLDRRVAAHVDRSRERQNTQVWLRRSARRAVQLMESEHFGLHGHSHRLVAEELRDQRQVEPLARPRVACGHFREQFIAQRPKVGPLEGHCYQPRDADSIRAGIARKASRRKFNVHAMLPRFPADDRRATARAS
jgi:hypothetical protein